MKKWFSIILLTVLGLVSCAGGEVNEVSSGEKLKVVATFYPLAYFAERIGGDFVHVANMVPVGGEPHDFEPSPSQIVQVTEADVALYLGLGFEPWMEDLEVELQAKEVVALEVNSKMPLLGLNDPHTWLDPILAQEIAIQISSAFTKADPSNETFYRQNSEQLMRELQDLHDQYQTKLSTCKETSLLVSHDAFNYLASRYNLDLIPVTGLSPEDEPSADALAQLADFAKENESKYIFFESLANPDVAETLAAEADLTPLVFNPIEGLTEAEAVANENYFTLMQSNLNSLALALSCQ